MQYSYSRDNRNEIDLQVSGMNYNILNWTNWKLSRCQHLTVNNEPINLDETIQLLLLTISELVDLAIILKVPLFLKQLDL